jgi:hypothetical protein
MMRFSESEIVEDVLEHIRQAGGEYREWQVGTAQDLTSRFPQAAHDGVRASGQAGGQPIGSGQEADGLLCREAYTTFAAQEVVERLAAFGLQCERETSPNQAPSARPGKTVFVCRLTAAPRQETPELRPAA